MGSSAFTFGDSTTAAFTTATEIAYDMVPGRQYRLYVSADAWISFVKAGGSGTVKAAAGTVPVAAKTSVLVSAIGALTRISVLQDSSGGNATLTEVTATIQS